MRVPVGPSLIVASCVALLLWIGLPSVPAERLRPSNGWSVEGVSPEDEAELAPLPARRESRRRTDLDGPCEPAAVTPAERADPEPPAVVDSNVVGTITGRVHVRAPGVHVSEIRVLARPASYVAGIGVGPESKLEDPDAHGWFVTTCDVDGGFVLGPGLDPAREYRVTAGGGGTAPRRAEAFERHRAGDFVELDLHSIVGVKVTFEDATGARARWGDHDCPLGWVGQVEGGVDDTPLQLELALNGLEAYRAEPDAVVRYALDVHGTLGTPEVGAGFGAVGRPAVRETVELRSVRDALHHVAIQLPFALDPGCPLTFQFPDRLAQSLVGDHAHSSLRIHLVIYEDMREIARLRPVLERGSTAWTTSALPAGRYRASFDLPGFRMSLARSPIQEIVKLGDPRTEFELGPQGATIFVPELPHATVRIEGVTEFNGTTQEIVLVDVHREGPSECEIQAFLAGRPFRFPVFLDAAPGQGAFVFTSRGPTPARFVDEEGRRAITLEDGDSVTLRPVHADPESMVPIGPSGLAR